MAYTILVPWHAFNLILSFPLLEDLAVITYGVWAGNNDDSDELSTVVQPSHSPVFTGSLELVRDLGSSTLGEASVNGKNYIST